MSLRHRIGALIYDWPRYRRAMRSGRWELMHNRDERVSIDGRGVKCEWQFGTDLHVAKVFPTLGANLMAKAFAQWPVIMADAPESLDDSPAVTFVIGHRGLERLPHLLTTLRSIAGQRGAAVECVVVEQSVQPEIPSRLPPWVRYIHTPVSRTDEPYNRAWTLNAGVRAARGDVVVLHDNDILVPSYYAAECAARAAEGWDFLEVKRFTFYLAETETRHVFESGELRTDVASTVVQNLQGASIGARRAAYLAIGGFDEDFVGWGGEDNEFWERAEVGGKAYRFGYLPFLHLYHAPQKEKLMGSAAPAVKRYHDLRNIPPQERINRLRELKGR